MKYNKYAIKRARAHTSRSRFRLSQGPYALFARFIAASVRAAGRVCKSPRFYNRALFRTVSSLSCFHGARRNIRQCRGVLAKLSVALGRLRFTRSCLASPHPTSPARRFACSLATWIPLRVLDAALLGPARLRCSPNGRERIGRKETRGESKELYAVYARERERK